MVSQFILPLLLALLTTAGGVRPHRHLIIHQDEARLIQSQQASTIGKPRRWRNPFSRLWTNSKAAAKNVQERRRWARIKRNLRTANPEGSPFHKLVSDITSDRPDRRGWALTMDADVMKSFIRKHPTHGVEAFELLAADEDGDVRFAAAESPALPELFQQRGAEALGIFQKLAIDDHWKVRKYVALYPAWQGAFQANGAEALRLFETLVADRKKEARQAAAESPAWPGVFQQNAPKALELFTNLVNTWRIHGGNLVREGAAKSPAWPKVFQQNAAKAFNLFKTVVSSTSKAREGAAASRIWPQIFKKSGKKAFDLFKLLLTDEDRSVVEVALASPAWSEAFQQNGPEAFQLFEELISRCLAQKDIVAKAAVLSQAWPLAFHQNATEALRLIKEVTNTDIEWAIVAVPAFPAWAEAFKENATEAWQLFHNLATSTHGMRRRAAAGSPAWPEAFGYNATEALHLFKQLATDKEQVVRIAAVDSEAAWRSLGTTSLPQNANLLEVAGDLQSMADAGNGEKVEHTRMLEDMVVILKKSQDKKLLEEMTKYPITQAAKRLVDIATQEANEERRKTLKALEEAKKERAAADEARQLAEAQRLAAETQRIAAEEARAESDFRRKEAVKAQRETERQRHVAENERQAAEDAREKVEIQRKEAVKAREEAEAQRQVAEKAREDSEAQRQLAVEAHKQTEVQRQVAEKERKAAEEARQEAEEEKQIAEARRKDAEEQRKEAEEARNESELQRQHAVEAQRETELQKREAEKAQKAAEEAQKESDLQRERAKEEARRALQQREAAEKAREQSRVHQLEARAEARKAYEEREVAKKAEKRAKVLLGVASLFGASAVFFFLLWFFWPTISRWREEREVIRQAKVALKEAEKCTAFESPFELKKPTSPVELQVLRKHRAIYEKVHVLYKYKYLNPALKATFRICAAALEKGLAEWDFSGVKKKSEEKASDQLDELAKDNYDWARNHVDKNPEEKKNWEPLNELCEELNSLAEEYPYAIENDEKFKDPADRCAEMYRQAFEAKSAYFDKTISEIAEKTGATAKLGDVKGIFRLAEKSTLRPNDGLVWDCVRAMVVGSTVEQLTQVLNKLKQEKLEERIKILKVTNRFVNPTPDGWQDIAVYIMFTNPAFNGLVAEVQLTHQALQAVRESFGAHDAYAATRFAAEALKIKTKVEVAGLPDSQRLSVTNTTAVTDTATKQIMAEGG